MHRANYLPVPHVFLLNQACLTLNRALGLGVYLVGSSLVKRDYRDVDVRAIVRDAEYQRMFPGIGIPQHHALWSLMCASISLYLEKLTGLPIDFQIQSMTEANTKYPTGERQALGLFVAESTPPSDGCEHTYGDSWTTRWCTRCGMTEPGIQRLSGTP